MSRIIHWKTNLHHAFLGLLGIVVSLPNLPATGGIPTRDSAAFLYMGQALINGKIPYVEAWDHKGIVLYLVNAVEAALSPQSFWGMYIVNLLLLFVCIAASYHLLTRQFGRSAALVSTTAWVMALPLLEFMNITGFIALPLSFVALILFARSSGQHRRRYTVAIGVLFALTLFIRPNLTAIYSAIGLWWLLEPQSDNYGSRVRSRIIFGGVGALSVIAAFAVYFLLTGSLDAMIDSYWHYNIIYSAGSDLDSFNRSVTTGYNLLAANGLAVVGLVGWVIALAAFVRSRCRLKQINPVVFVATTALPVEILFSSVSQFAFPHYYISWLPALAVLMAFSVKLFVDLAGERFGLAFRNPIVVLLLVSIVAIPLARVIQNLRNAGEGDSTYYDIVDYISQQSTSGDTLLVWGADASLNFLTGLPAPSRYFYHYPLFVRGYGSMARFKEFLAEVEKNRPKLVIDASSNTIPIPPLNAEARARWSVRLPEIYELTSEADVVFSYFEENYQILTNEFDWPIYVRNDVGSAIDR